MKKLFYIFVLSLLCHAAVFSQVDNPPPVVIKQEGASLQTDPEEEDVRNLPFSKRIRFGLGGLSLGFSSFSNYFSISPMVGYQLTNQMIAGLEVPYQTTWGGRFSSGSFSLIGYRGFLRHDIPFLSQLIGNGYARAEYEQYSVISSGQTFTPSPAVLAGIGLGMTRGAQLLIMYNLNYGDGLNSVYSSPVVFRLGYSF